MALLYWKGSTLSSGRNFGDLLNPHLLEPLLDAERLARRDVLGIGTILDNRFVKDRSGLLVFGSGIGHGALPEHFATFTPLLVRGPHTALEFGDPSLPQGDPGYLLEAGRGAPQQAGGVLVPHYKTNKRLPMAALSRLTGLRCVDIRQAPDQFLPQLATARFAYVEAMHAAIACEALRIPWAPVQLVANEPWVKWMDALGPIGRRYWQPVRQRPKYARKDLELLSRKYLASRFPGGFAGEGTELAPDAQLAKVRKAILGQVDRFNGGDW